MISYTNLTQCDAHEFIDMTYQSYKCYLQSFGVDTLAIGAKLSSEPIGLILCKLELDAKSTILSIFVKNQHRNKGVGTNLIELLCAQLSQKGIDLAEIVYKTNTSSTNALEKILHKCNWQEPRFRQLLCETDGVKLFKAEWFQTYKLPSSFEIIAWQDITNNDRESIRKSQATNPWIPIGLDPLVHEKDYEPINSLALCYQGEIVGWLITHRLDKRTIRYTCSFLRPDLQNFGRLVALYIEGAHRQAEAIGIDSNALWTVPLSHPRMANFVKRRFAPYMKSIGEFKFSQKILNP